MCQNIKFNKYESTVAKNIPSCRILFMIVMYNHNGTYMIDIFYNNFFSNLAVVSDKL